MVSYALSCTRTHCLSRLFARTGPSRNVRPHPANYAYYRRLRSFAPQRVGIFPGTGRGIVSQSETPFHCVTQKCFTSLHRHVRHPGRGGRSSRGGYRPRVQVGFLHVVPRRIRRAHPTAGAIRHVPCSLILIISRWMGGASIGPRSGTNDRWSGGSSVGLPSRSGRHCPWRGRPEPARSTEETGVVRDSGDPERSANMWRW